MNELLRNLTDAQKKLLGRFCRVVLTQLKGKSKITKFKLEQGTGLCDNLKLYCRASKAQYFPPFKLDFPFDSDESLYYYSCNKFTNKERMVFVEECAKTY